MENVSEDTKAFLTTAKVYSGELDKVQIIDYYNTWDDYEKDLQPGRYNGPVFAAEAIDRSFPSHKDQVLILDVAAGTGFVGEEVCNYKAYIHLVKRNFKEIHALDPSASMLMKAKKKNVYKKFLCEFVNPEPSPTIDNGKPAHVLQHIDVQWQIQEFQNRGSGPSAILTIVWSVVVDLGVDIFLPVPSKNSYESQSQAV
ncbi:methyltransferase-like protein 27 isoform X5 [Crassostrea virginica]